MNGMIALLLIVALFVVIDLLAVQFGVDSREPIGDDHTYFQRFRPVATAGYSIFIYHIDRDECNRVRAELGLPPWR